MYAIIKPASWMRGIVATLLLAGSLGAQAALLGELPGYPDLFVDNMAASYDAGSDVFTISSTAISPFTLEGSLIAADYFRFTAKIDAAGNLVSDAGNVLEIRDGGASGTLRLSAVPTAFGFAITGLGGNDNGVFDALFNVTSEDIGFGSSTLYLLSNFDDLGGAGATEPVSFAADFASQDLVDLGVGTGVVDLAPPLEIPAPGTAVLLVAGLLGLRRFARRPGALGC